MIPAGKLPDFILIGAMKAGTTSLHYYLGLHPQISASKEKELNFFVEERNWTKGTDWYRAQFANRGLSGEGSPIYTAFPQFQGVPRRMQSVVPEARLIYILRDPIERMISHYIHRFAYGLEDRGVEEALLQPENNFYLDRSRYFLQLSQFLQSYALDRILILTQEDLSARRSSTLDQAFRFLGVAPGFRSRGFQRIRHVSKAKRRYNQIGNRLRLMPKRLGMRRLAPDLAYQLGYCLAWPFSRAIGRPRLDPDARTILQRRLEADVAQLRELTRRRFRDWTI